MAWWQLQALVSGLCWILLAHGTDMQLAKGVTGHREGTQLEHTLHKVKAGTLLGMLGTALLIKRAKRPAGEAQNIMYVAGVLRSKMRSLTEASVRPKP